VEYTVSIFDDDPLISIWYPVAPTEPIHENFTLLLETSSPSAGPLKVGGKGDALSLQSHVIDES
jgi:hypothetical protein